MQRVTDKNASIAALGQGRNRLNGAIQLNTDGNYVLLLLLLQGWAKPTTLVSPGADFGVPNWETRIAKPVAYASIISCLPITRPTCPGDLTVPSAPAKKTRSP